MKENLFEMGANLSDEWTSDNKDKTPKKVSTDIKTADKHQLHFAKEKRRGKVVTIVQPFYLSNNELKALLKILKKKLGTGGTIKENRLEFQGEIKEELKVQLKKLGYALK
ncbi:MAG: Translation initiation factor SUI1-related protein [uncultured Sulfurovum sp.]|uniref:Translation initiation factor SUI1-related protein n=1 Tax=uncultured Sulfurovum sp. TaxID=269237 RepID=A0A6S6S7B5_9BACT|nr:MAG: Translation initiation factor SUI1-related protein [uncultured Sulfurovum sp.]